MARLRHNWLIIKAKTSGSPYFSAMLRCLIPCFILLASRLPAQYVFSHWDKSDGLPSMTTHDVMQDRDGYIWVASVGGLSRYNGSQFKAFLPDSRNPRAIHTGMPRRLVQAADGHIWIGSRDGAIDRFDPKTGHFQAVSMPDSLIELTWDIFQDQTGTVWVGNHKSLLRYHPAENALRPHLPARISSEAKKRLRSTGIMGIVQSPDDPDLLYLSNYIGSVFRYRLSTDSLDEVRCPFPEVRRTGHLFFHSNGRIYFYTAPNLVISYDPASGQWEKFSIPGASYNRSSSFLLEKSPTELWVPTRTVGLGILNVQTGQWQFLKHDPDIAASIRPGGLYAMCFDRRGDLWLSTDGQGLQKLEFSKRNFQHFDLRNLRADTLENIFVFDVLPLSDGNLLASTEGGFGLYVFDPQRRLLRKSSVKTGSVPPILSLFPDKIGNIWAATEKGIFEVDPKTLQLMPAKIGPRPLPTGSFGKFLPDRTGNCWAMCRAPKGFLKMNATMNDWQFFAAKDSAWSALSKIYLNDFAFDAQGNIWVSGTDGLVKMDFAAGRAQHFPPNALGNDGAARYFGNMVIDRNGRLWLAQNNHGILILTLRPDGTFAHESLRRENGLPTDMGTLMAADEQGGIWFGTEEGLCHIDSKTKHIRAFSTDDGLLRNNLHLGARGSVTRLDDGRIMVGGLGYFTLFDPAQLPTNTEPPPVTIDELLVHERDTAILFWTNHLNSLTLSYLQNSFTLNFAALNFISPAKNRFRYRMEGLSRAWQTTSETSVTFSQLSPGRYVFQVLAANNDGVWNETGRSLEIIIRPPFYQTWWFYLLCAAAAAAAIWRFYRWRIEQIEARARLRTEFNRQLAEVQMTALRAQMNPHFLFNSLNSVKNYIAQNDPRMAARYLTKFSRLMRLILNNSKTHAVPLAHELETLELYLELEAMRFAEKFDYQIVVSPDVDTEAVEIPPMILQPYIENAIWHGFMTKGAKGHLRLEVARAADGKLVVEIDDDGIGRARAEELKKASGAPQKSMGMGITAERLSLINQLFNRNLKVEIADKAHPDGSPAGTLVRLEMPA